MLCTIVGTGYGLGAALARRFGRGGFQIALVARTDKPALTASLAEHGVGARLFRADVSDERAIEHAFADIDRWGGQPDVLIYNAAKMSPGAASALTARSVADDMAINLGGAIACVMRVLPGMKQRRRGTIIFTGGGLALEPYPLWASLGAGKAALRAYAIALQKELASEDVRVSVVAVCGLVAPDGPFDPDLIADSYWRIHVGQQPVREVVYVPAGSDLFYNDEGGVYRDLSFPITLPPGATHG